MIIGFPIALVAFAFLFPSVIIVGIVVCMMFGLLFMQIGGPIISVVSILDKTDQFDTPLWFSYVKWGTVPLRLFENATSILNLSEIHLEKRD